MSQECDTLTVEEPEPETLTHISEFIWDTPHHVRLDAKMYGPSAEIYESDYRYFYEARAYFAEEWYAGSNPYMNPDNLETVIGLPEDVVDYILSHYGDTATIKLARYDRDTGEWSVIWENGTRIIPPR